MPEPVRPGADGRGRRDDHLLDHRGHHPPRWGRHQPGDRRVRRRFWPRASIATPTRWTIAGKWPWGWTTRRTRSGRIDGRPRRRRHDERPGRGRDLAPARRPPSVPRRGRRQRVLQDPARLRQPRHDRRRLPSSASMAATARRRRSTFTSRPARSARCSSIRLRRPSASFATVVESNCPDRRRTDDELGRRATRVRRARRAASACAGHVVVPGRRRHRRLLAVLPAAEPGDAAATATSATCGRRRSRRSTAPTRCRRTVAHDHPRRHAGPELATPTCRPSITATAPIIVERAMYRTAGAALRRRPRQPPASTAPPPAGSWPKARPGRSSTCSSCSRTRTRRRAQVDVRLPALDGGVTFTQELRRRRRSRADDLRRRRADFRRARARPLANVAVSARSRSTNGVPIIVERTMWWPGPAVTPAFWTEAHNSPGATGTATRWALADGESAGMRTETFVLIANTSSTAGRVRVTRAPRPPRATKWPATSTANRDRPRRASEQPDDVPMELRFGTRRDALWRADREHRDGAARRARRRARHVLERRRPDMGGRHEPAGDAGALRRSRRWAAADSRQRSLPWPSFALRCGVRRRRRPRRSPAGVAARATVPGAAAAALQRPDHRTDTDTYSGLAEVADSQARRHDEVDCDRRPVWPSVLPACGRRW